MRPQAFICLLHISTACTVKAKLATQLVTQAVTHDVTQLVTQVVTHDVTQLVTQVVTQDTLFASI